MKQYKTDKSAEYISWITDNMTLGELKELMGTECWVVDDSLAWTRPRLRKAFIIEGRISMHREEKGEYGSYMTMSVAEGDWSDSLQSAIDGRHNLSVVWGFARTPEDAIKAHNQRMDGRKLGDEDLPKECDDTKKNYKELGNTQTIDLQRSAALRIGKK